MIRECTVSDVAVALRLGKSVETSLGRGVFLIGAGCSVSAGIPAGRRIAEMAAVDSAARLGMRSADDEVYTEDNCQRALDWLMTGGYLPPGTTWRTAYSAIFDGLLSDPVLQKQAIVKAVHLGGGRINWTHVVLGHIVAEGLVNTVLTTNFDQLALQGLTLSGVRAVVADGVESLSRIDRRAATPQLVHLHGSLNTYQMRNSRRAVEELGQNRMVISALTGLLQEASALVVVGYAGGEEGIMNVLINAVGDLGGSKNVFWVHHDEDANGLSVRAKELLRAASLGGVIVGQDSDLFFKDLARDLGVGAPHWLSNPVDELLVRAEALVRPVDEDIRAVLDDYSHLLVGLNDALDQHRRTQRAEQEVITALMEARELELKGDSEGALRLIEPFGDHSPEASAKLGDLRKAAGLTSGDSSLLTEARHDYQRSIALLQDSDDGKPTTSLRIKLGDVVRVLGTQSRDPQLLLEALKTHIEAYYSAEDTGDSELAQRALSSLRDDYAALTADHPKFAEDRLQAVSAKLANLGIGTDT